MLGQPEPLMLQALQRILNSIANYEVPVSLTITEGNILLSHSYAPWEAGTMPSLSFEHNRQTDRQTD